MPAPARHSRLRGFTLIELLVVLAITGLLLSIALPNYFAAERRAREVVLSENLRVMRASLQAFMADQGRYPRSLDELVAQRYLTAIPTDPVTGSTRTWVVETGRGGATDTSGFPASAGVTDVRSGARGTAADGRAYGAL